MLSRNITRTSNQRPSSPVWDERRPVTDDPAIDRIAAIVPAYNAEETIAACLGALVAQTRRPDEIILFDDGSSALSFPETPLLAVLPGTGGLTRLVDKRRVRRDLADVFCTLAEGVRGKRAKDWGLVDHVYATRDAAEEAVKL